MDDRLVVAASDEQGGAETLLNITSTRARAATIEVARMFAFSSREIEVDGHPAVLLARFERRPGPFAVLWRTPAGQVVTVDGLGLSRAETLAVAGSLEPLTEDEWRALRGRVEDCFGVGRPPGA